MKKGSKHTSGTIAKLRVSLKAARKYRIVNCEICGAEVTTASNNLKYCKACAMKLTLEDNRQRAERNKEKYDQSRRLKAAKNRKPVSCKECGMEFEKKSRNQQFCPTCAIKRGNEARERWVDRNPEKVRIHQDECNRKAMAKRTANLKQATCSICGKVFRKMGNEVLCSPACRKSARVWNQRRRDLSKRISGIHTRADFLELCAARGWKCEYCGKPLTIKTATEDHRIPIRDGGSNDIENIVPSCLSCNCSKGSLPVDVFIERREQRQCISVA